MKRCFLLLAVTLFAAPAFAFDQTYADWTALLQTHVVLADHGDASRLNYAALKRDPARLDAVTRALSRVTAKQYAGDFAHGWHGITSVRQLLAVRAVDVTADHSAEARIRAQKVPIDYLDYDWTLNDVHR